MSSASTLKSSIFCSIVCSLSAVVSVLTFSRCSSLLSTLANIESYFVMIASRMLTCSSTSSLMSATCVSSLPFTFWYVWRISFTSLWNLIVSMSWNDKSFDATCIKSISRPKRCNVNIPSKFRMSSNVVFWARLNACTLASAAFCVCILCRFSYEGEFSSLVSRFSLNTVVLFCSFSGRCIDSAKSSRFTSLSYSLILKSWQQSLPVHHCTACRHVAYSLCLMLDGIRELSRSGIVNKKLILESFLITLFKQLCKLEFVKRRIQSKQFSYFITRLHSTAGLTESFERLASFCRSTAFDIFLWACRVTGLQRPLLNALHRYFTFVSDCILVFILTQIEVIRSSRHQVQSRCCQVLSDVKHKHSVSKCKFGLNFIF